MSDDTIKDGATDAAVQFCMYRTLAVACQQEIASNGASVMLQLLQLTRLG